MMGMPTARPTTPTRISNEEGSGPDDARPRHRSRRRMGTTERAAMSHQPSSRSPRPRDPSFPNPESQSHADHDARHDAHGDARRTGSADGWEMVIERLTTLLLGDRWHPVPAYGTLSASSGCGARGPQNPSDSSARSAVPPLRATLEQSLNVPAFHCHLPPNRHRSPGTQFPRRRRG